MRHNQTQGWAQTKSPYGDGTWFVHSRDIAIEIMAPPGVRVLPNSAEHTPAWIEGWRAALWTFDDDIAVAVEVEPPQYRRALSTAEALYCLGDAHHDVVEQLMVDLLFSAATLGQTSESGGLQDTSVQVSVSLVLWIKSELDAAFPGRTWRDPGPALLSSEVPDTFEEVMALLAPNTFSASTRTLRPGHALALIPTKASPCRAEASLRPHARTDWILSLVILGVETMTEGVRILLEWISGHGAGRGADPEVFRELPRVVYTEEHLSAGLPHERPHRDHRRAVPAR
ncbi:MAG TPA: hypothetical protein VFY45_26680 [Baekduia sp.]|nr:hypothetical protein [Baekduia sp.]